ncbi:hypothetical protein GCM10018785_45090 [Streptomyces longispororuber]|uniref:Uncharacterized protein n=1 Tax=Streptomyces longispororuber TaxID=68230 RepID=A0A918ZV68_9ACTN|nr:hypothetical protein GCM10018785_45090 [Streptomyces longispororuber]
MLSNFMSEAWPEYVAGVLALATGAAASALIKAWRRRRHLRRRDEGTADSPE